MFIRLYASFSFRYHFIDINYLLSLPIAEEAVRTMLDSYPITICHTKVPLTVLGVLSMDIEVNVTWRVDSIQHISPREVGSQKVILTGVLVVHRLPVPLHISYLGKEILRTTMVSPRDSGFHVLDSCNFPQEYQSHPYWFSTKSF